MMRVKTKDSLKLCSEKPDPYMRVLSLQKSSDKFSGLEYLAYLLNNPQYDENKDLRPQSAVLKRLFEDMIIQPSSKIENVKNPKKIRILPKQILLSWVKSNRFESLLLGPEFDPSADSPLAYLNQIAKQNPITLRFIGSKKGRSIKILTSFEDFFKDSPVSGVLLLLSNEYFGKEGWKRLKCCPQCSNWFVDRTRKNNKARCSSYCTSRWWSWGRRRKEGHRLPLKKTKRTKGPRKKR